MFEVSLLMLRKSLLRILENYSVESLKSFEDNNLVDFISESFKHEVEGFFDFRSNYIVKTFTVLKKWCDVPWIGIFNPVLTSSVDDGCFAIILFKSDMSGVYLSINLGFNELNDNYPDNVLVLRNEVNAEFPDNFLYTMNNVEDFSKTCVIAKEYSINDLKSEDCSVEKDLNDFLGFYHFLISSDSAIPIVTWKELLQDKTVINDKMLDVLNIMYDMGGHATFGEIAEVRNKQNPNLNEKSYNSLNINAGRRVKRKLFKLPMLNNNNIEFFFEWLFNVKSKNNLAEFILRPNLRHALKELRDENPKFNTQLNVNKVNLDFYDYLLSKGYYFDKELIENFLLSIKVKPFLILTGNSGTGKTKLVQLYAEYIQGMFFDSLKEDIYKIIPVGSNWTDNHNILGYQNVIMGDYQSTPAYDLIKSAQENLNVPFFLVLDEMNLSHVERYFSDFLSAIESGEKIPLYGTNDELNIPGNLFIIGTVNIDETTYMFSPKVLDRANTIEFKTIPVNYYMQNKLGEEHLNGDLKFLYNPLSNQILSENNIKGMREILKNVKTNDENMLWDTLSDELTKIQEILTPSGFDFGFRVVNEIIKFMIVSWEYEKTEKSPVFKNWSRYFDAQILQKILPKIHGSEKSLGETLTILKNHCHEKNYIKSYEKLEEMENILKNQKFVSFIK